MLYVLAFFALTFSFVLLSVTKWSGWSIVLAFEFGLFCWINVKLSSSPAFFMLAVTRRRFGCEGERGRRKALLVPVSGE